MTTLLDLHFHPALPVLGRGWRTGVQGFRLASLDGAAAGNGGSAGISGPGPGLGNRIYGASFYETYMLRPLAARARLLKSLRAFRGRLESQSGRNHRLILKAADLEATADSGESFFLAVESLRYLRDPADIKTLFDLGIRSLQPIHFLSTPWGGSSGEGILPEDRSGLTGLGREMLAEMARAGFILDLAHMSYRTAEESLKAYTGPVMCSHTGLEEIRSSPRNLPSDLAREVFRRGGVVGVTCWRHLLGKSGRAKNGPAANGRGSSNTQATQREAWTQAYCATAVAIEGLTSCARVAIGSDRGAPIHAPAWFYSPGHLAELAEVLETLGWDKGRIQAFFHGNALDFLKSSLPG